MVKPLVAIFFGVLILLGIVDLYLYLMKGEADTLSADILNMARAYPIIPLAVGVLVGHLFWPQKM